MKWLGITVGAAAGVVAIAASAVVWAGMAYADYWDHA